MSESSVTLSPQMFTSARHTTHYFEAGPAGGPLLIFVHGWPEIGLMWRAQITALAAAGYRCIAPDMRASGGSSAPDATGACTLEEIARDMTELHDHLGGSPAIWIGHDWGSPVAGMLAAHFPERARGIALISLPYFPETFALSTLIPLIDRQLYPAEKYLYGQWNYFRFYQTNFDTAVSDLDGDIPASLASIYRSGNPEAKGTFSQSALTTANGGRFGAAHRAPEMPPDAALWPPEDFERLVAAFRRTGFRSACAWYLNDDANLAYARSAPDGGRLSMPVLCINSDYDPIAGIGGNRLSDPMRDACSDLSVVNVPTGHWTPLECKTETTEALRSWLKRTGHAVRQADLHESRAE